MKEPTPSAENLAPPTPILTVSLLNRLARERLEAALPLCWVAGEISNLTYAASGHVYFSLKDSGAQVRCVMFRTKAQLLGWRLENGQHIEARVLVTLYEARGDFQLNVEAARKAGIGNLYEQFLRLKERLEKEGLFAAESKRPLPSFPRRLGIITSRQAAALRDVLTALARRAPHVDVIIYPVPVQGEGAARQIARMIRKAGERRECDALILCRGGGSLEDLWAFNDEEIARAIRACALPLITGIGHETDFTIADFAADRRAATPTAAAEQAAPEKSTLEERLLGLHRNLHRQLMRELERRSLQLDQLAHRLLHPGQRLARQRDVLADCCRRLAASLRQRSTQGRLELAALDLRLQLARPSPLPARARLELLAGRLKNAWHTTHERRTARLSHIGASLHHLDPQAILARGYSIVTDGSGNILNDSRVLEPNDRIIVSFHAGRAEATVTRIEH